jgi:murein DD-endopeptidase MepM/ murein hydrolase activator NlpD
MRAAPEHPSSGRNARGSRASTLGVAAALAAILGLSACPRPARRGPDLGAHSEPDLDGTLHLVQPGETLWGIARRYEVKPAALARANGLDERAELKPGQEIFVPFEPQAPATAAVPSRPAPLAWPLVGVIYARFGPRGETRHDGVDIAAPEGTEIGAAADGEVLFSGEQKGYGNLVILQHAGALVSVYAHNRGNLVKEGERVRRGQRLATVGVASRTSGPHLHFEVREGTVPKNPLQFLPPPP